MALEVTNEIQSTASNQTVAQAKYIADNDFMAAHSTTDNKQNTINTWLAGKLTYVPTTAGDNINKYLYWNDEEDHKKPEWSTLESIIGTKTDGYVLAGKGNNYNVSWQSIYDTLGTQNANTFLAGPISGSATTPSFRTLNIGDIQTPLPNLYAIESLSGTGYLRRTGNNTWSLNTPTDTKNTVGVGSADYPTGEKKCFVVVPFSTMSGSYAKSYVPDQRFYYDNSGMWISDGTNTPKQVATQDYVTTAIGNLPQASPATHNNHPKGLLQLLSGDFIPVDTFSHFNEYLNTDNIVAVPVLYGRVSQNQLWKASGTTQVSGSTETADKFVNPATAPLEHGANHFVNVRDVFNGIIRNEEMMKTLVAIITYLQGQGTWPWWRDNN